MSINSNFSYLFFLKDSGVNSFLQNSPNKHYKVNKNDASLDRVFRPNNIQNIESLNQLVGFIKTSNNCPLKNQALNTVFADGNPSSKIMLIGEAPGAEENKLGKPFVGAAGQLLNKMLAAINLDRNSVYITNIVPWRPPNNRTPNTEEILQCLPFIQKHIEII
ncbi:MAG: uracil-DNA glycosylase, partial [SAR202 cluster bacterium]|nr:uracil-DNA glycosylase [SAR202 cluster bacterium]